MTEWLPLRAHADVRALLVGVSEYPALAPEVQLQGPRNDVPLLRTVLVRRGVPAERIAIVADGVAGGLLPTRANILKALEDLASEVRRNDFVVIYFSGHGAQVATDSDVPPPFRRASGLQQVFVARDVNVWNQTMQRVPNVIFDYEVTALVDRIRERGARVWAIFDTCHSGSFARGGDHMPGRRARGLAPGQLGIPPLPPLPPVGDIDRAQPIGLLVEQSEASVRGGNAPTTSDSRAAGYVAFYAAEPHETTEELELPAGSASRQAHGLFSYWLEMALARAPAEANFRALGDYIRAAYAADNRHIPTPVFTGNLLDAPLLGGVATPPQQQWPVQGSGAGFTIDAGVLDQVTTGSVLNIVPDALAEDAAALAVVRVTRAELLRSEASLDGSGDRAALPALRGSAMARLVSPALDFQLRVAIPESIRAEPRRDAWGVLEAARKRIAGGERITWVGPAEPAQLEIVLEADRLVLLSTDERARDSRKRAHRGISIRVPEAADRLAGEFMRASKALNLMRIAAAMSNQRSSSRLEIQAERLRNGHASPLDPGNVMEVRAGDRIRVQAHNTDPYVAEDLTALYLDSDFGIQTMFPRGVSGRVPATMHSQAGTPATFSFRVNDRTFGLEYLVLIAARAVSGAAPRDFSYLEQDGLERKRGSSDTLTALFDDAGYASPASPGSRGLPSPLAQQARITVYSLRVMPPPEVPAHLKEIR